MKSTFGVSLWHVTQSQYMVSQSAGRATDFILKLILHVARKESYLSNPFL